MKSTFVKEFMKLDDESVIKKLTKTLKKETQTSQTSIKEFAGILNAKDAQAFLEASLECRQVDINEW